MDIDPIVTELVKLRTAEGLIVPEDVVESARSKASPLHDCFQWNNSLAAHQHRLWQARTLIRTRVTVVNDSLPVETRVFVSLTPDRQAVGGGYRCTVDVLSHKGHREQLLEDALSEMETFQQKYSRLQELAGVLTAIKRTLIKFK